MRTAPMVSKEAKEVFPEEAILNLVPKECTEDSQARRERTAL